MSDRLLPDFSFVLTQEENDDIWNKDIIGVIRYSEGCSILQNSSRNSISKQGRSPYSHPTMEFCPAEPIHQIYNQTTEYELQNFSKELESDSYLSNFINLKFKDIEIIDKSYKGDSKALEEIFIFFSPIVFHCFLSDNKNKKKSVKLTELTFSRLIMSLQRYKPPAQYSWDYLVSILKYTFIDTYSRNSKHSYYHFDTINNELCYSHKIILSSQREIQDNDNENKDNNDKYNNESNEKQEIINIFQSLQKQIEKNKFSQAS